MREAPNLESTVRGIHTIDGGSHPLLVSYFVLAHHTIHGGRSLITYSTSTKYLILVPKLKTSYCPTLQHAHTTTCPHVLLGAYTLDLNRLGLPKIHKVALSGNCNSITIVVPFSSLYTLSMLAKLVGFVVTCLQYSLIVGQLWISLCSGQQPCSVVEWKCQLVSVMTTERN